MKNQNAGKQKGTNKDNAREDKTPRGDEKYKYHASQIENDREHADEYPDKPKNHTTTAERLLNPDRGED